jgi:hypothetical protein
MGMKMVIFSVMSFLILITGCQNKAYTGAGIGALVGAGVGQAAGSSTESTVIGAAIGAGAGYLIGAHEQNKEVQEHPDAFTKIEFTNSDGTTTTVALRKSDGGYIGPEGEFYSELPSRSEMKERYGH